MSTLYENFENKDLDLCTINPYIRCVNFIDCERGKVHNVPRRALYDFAMICIMEGELCFIYEDKEIVLKKGDIHLMPPHVLHKEFTKQDVSCKFFNVNFDFFYDSRRKNWQMEEMYNIYCRKELEEMPFLKKFCNPNDKNNHLIARPVKIEQGLTGKMVDVLQEMYDIYCTSKILLLQTQPQMDVQMILRSKFLMILSNLLGIDKKFDDIRRPSKSIASFLSYVEYHYNEQFILNDVVHSMGFSPNYFRTIFKQETGNTPRMYLTRFRIKLALDKLREDVCSIEEIAESVGFNDPFYFSKVFKALIGISPSQWRNLNKNVNKKDKGKEK